MLILVPFDCMCAFVRPKYHGSTYGDRVRERERERKRDRERDIYIRISKIGTHQKSIK